MRRIRLESEVDFAGWRDAARHLLVERVPPEAVAWSVAGTETAGTGYGELDLDVGEARAVAGQSAARPFVPRAFVALAEQAILHRDPERFAMLYALLWRVGREPGLMEVVVDPLVARLAGMTKAIRRDIHKMHAFVRFRAIETETGEQFIAWFEPDHHIVEAAAPFFQRRFAAMRWSILTPERSVHWDGETLVFGDGASRADAPGDDKLEELWRRYYASIFNPARLKVAMMRSEMPEKYWKNLPEARLIKPLSDKAARRMSSMIETGPQEPNPRPQRSILMDYSTTEPVTIEAANDLAELRAAAAGCEACPLYRPATQTVFGEGSENADIVFVGEQPGDSEDIAGHPFVGPAGQLFDRALAESGVERRRTYVTNAVKHFKFEPRGKRRIHQKPNTSEIKACRPWLVRELEMLRPKLVVALGATAVQSILGKALPINANRGRPIDLPSGARLMITVHPSYLLRLPDEAAKQSEYARFVDDLRAIPALAA